MSVNFKGDVGVNVENVQRSWSEESGWESVYTYKGPWSAIEAASVNSAYVGNSARVNVRQEAGAYGVLEVVFASIDNTEANTTATEADSDNWTFAPYKVQKNIWEHEYFDDLDDTDQTSATFKALKQRVITAVDAYKAAIENANAEGTAYTAPIDLDASIDWTTSGVLTPEQAKAKSLAFFLLAGRETYEASKYSLRNSMVLPANTALAVSHWRTGYQWTTNRLVDLILAQKSSVTKYAICGDLLNTFAGTYWLKEAPVINELAGGKFEVVSEFTNYKNREMPSILYPFYG